MSEYAVGLVITLEARPARQPDVIELLNGLIARAAHDADTVSWYAYRVTDSTFGVTATFADDEARAKHLSGSLVQAVHDATDDLLVGPPTVKNVGIIATKTPVSVG